MWQLQHQRGLQQELNFKVGDKLQRQRCGHNQQQQL